MSTLKLPVLVIDTRLIGASGIGTVLQNTIPYFLSSFRVILLGNIPELQKFAWASQCEMIEFNTAIYSLKEQAAFLSKIPVCDIFFSPHYNVPVFAIKAKKRIVIIHDVNHIALGSDLSWPKRVYAQYVIAKALKLSQHIITVSNFSKSEITKYFKTNEDRIHPIKLGVDHQVFRPYTAFAKEEVKKKYNLPDHFILYVGNVKPHKNIKTLVNAFGLLKKEQPYKNYKLVIVGKKDGFITKDNALFNQITTLNLNDAVLFTGFVSNEDLPLIYNLAALFVFPSLYEGFGLPPVEAMACGCPTLVAHSSSLPEVCQDATLYFNPTDPVALYNNMVRVINSSELQQQLLERGLALALTYNWESTAQQIKNIISE